MDQPIESRDLFIRKRRGDTGLAVVNFVSVDGTVNYRIKGARRTYYSSQKNFLKNWKKLEPMTTETPRDE